MSSQEACQCEHESHFDKKVYSPNGNPNHKYGVKYFSRFMRTVKTDYGTFRVCKHCAEDCFGKKVEEESDSDYMARTYGPEGQD